MDVNMPVMDGIEATVLIMEEWPDTLVVGFSASDELNTKARMLKAGAVDLLDKCDPGSALVPALHRLWDARR
jgi:CheY-like chemotaxis protein